MEIPQPKSNIVCLIINIVMKSKAFLQGTSKGIYTVIKLTIIILTSRTLYTTGRLSYLIKQKTILYISIVFFSLMALYVNSFLKERNNFEVDAITQNVKIYQM